MEKRNERSEKIGNCLRVWAEYRVEDLLQLQFNVDRMHDAMGHDASIVKRYADMTTPFPSIKIRKVPEGMWVTDGGHRLAAAHMRGDEWIPTLELPCE